MKRTTRFWVTSSSRRCRWVSSSAMAVLSRGGRPPRPAWRRLPDRHAPAGIEVERVGRLHVERGVPRVQVAHGQRAEVGGRVAVGREELPQRGLALLALPALPVGEEELLVAGEAVLHGG